VESGPRIYNLFPLLVGPVARWKAELPRIAAMGFDWVYVNPFHYPGFSGSLYAVKDSSRLHPLFGEGDADTADALLRSFVESAAGHGLSVMMDLIVNHTARDALLTDEHPEWFARNPDNTLKSPVAVDPVDPTIVTEWGDLAAIDYGQETNHPALIDHWGGLVRHYARLGFAGFRCDAAYQVPAVVWAGIIGEGRRQNPHLLFAAETLGCTTGEVQALAGAGFDLLFNSAKWWDFHAPWLLEQYETLRHIAPSVAFPESHDTERLVAEVAGQGDVQAWYRLRALFSAFFSAGWMMPIGYEYGFGQRLDVVTSRPDHGEVPAFDLSPFIAQVNRLKATSPALNAEGPLVRLSDAASPVVALLRRTPDGSDAALLLMNTDWRQKQSVDAALLQPQPGFAWIDEVPRNAILGPLEALVWRARAVRTRMPAAAERSVRLPAVREAVPLGTFLDAHSSGIVIEAISPSVDGGRHAIKREVGDVLEVTADILRHGHDHLAARVLWRWQGDDTWHDTAMAPQGNDRWIGRFPLDRNSRADFTIEAWVDAYESWRSATVKKRDAGQVVGVELAEGSRLLLGALPAVHGVDRERLQGVLAQAAEADETTGFDLLTSALVRGVMGRWPVRSRAVRADRLYPVVVDRVRARFAAWYEMMVRSQGSQPGRGSTFREAERRLPDIARMGFDVVYLLPIHPIGRVHRKGPDNTLVAGEDDPGSPYAIGSQEGGHTAIHPELGTLDDFRHFVAAARALGMEVALDFAIQCAPDHPWVRQHPEWFAFRPDGSIRYAENPPKLYQDIVNVDFDGVAAEPLWRELLEVVLFWVGEGVRTFRVDNPHTKPLPFWEWLIRTVHDQYPDVIFLAEAFTRPKIMQALAKIGFTQSYTYFTWRSFKRELTDYLTELTQGEAREVMRPHFFATTPDILPPYLQTGGRAAFRIRLVLAATLSSLYGIYNGYELCEAAGLPGREEYLHSEKYQHKVWDWNRQGNIKDDIARLNAIRRANPALQEFENLRFHACDDEAVLFYGKASLDRSNMVLVAVTLDPFDVHEVTLTFPVEAMGVPPGETFEAEDLLSGQRHLWRGPDHRVRLDPAINPAMIWRVTVWEPVDYRTPCF
jgi:starch synthase (maltosyl-transferring)